MGETLQFYDLAILDQFAVASTSFSGEIRNVQRAIDGSPGAMLLMGIAFILLLGFYENVFGGSFLLSASANGLPIEAPPFVPFFTAVLGGNVVLPLSMSIWVLAIAIFVTGTTPTTQPRGAGVGDDGVASNGSAT